MSTSPKLEFRLFVINKPPEEHQEIRQNERRIQEQDTQDSTNTSNSSSPETSATEETRSEENVLRTNNSLTTVSNSDETEEYRYTSSDNSDSELRAFKRKKTFVQYSDDERNSEEDSSEENYNANMCLRSAFKSDNLEQAKIYDARLNSQRRYPKRSLKPVNYKEKDEDDCDDDCYIYCDICEEEFYDGCKIHPLRNIYDTFISSWPRNIFRARLTIPYKYLRIDYSNIPKAGEGVLSNRRLSAGLRFGPYQGTSVDTNNGGYYSWQIKKNGKVVNIVDGYDESISNWMRFVNCARDVAEQNVMAFVYRGEIFYRTVKVIPKNTEILVYYGNDYANELNINIKNFHYLFKPNQIKPFNCSY